MVITYRDIDLQGNINPIPNLWQILQKEFFEA